MICCLQSDEVALRYFNLFLVSINVSEQFFRYKVLKISSFTFGLWLYGFWCHHTDDFKSLLNYAHE